MRGPDLLALILGRSHAHAGKWDARRRPILAPEPEGELVSRGKRVEVALIGRHVELDFPPVQAQPADGERAITVIESFSEPVPGGKGGKGLRVVEGMGSSGS